jgi:pimeloyl-ACP methyl ester carboxylesterase
MAGVAHQLVIPQHSKRCRDHRSPAGLPAGDATARLPPGRRGWPADRVPGGPMQASAYLGDLGGLSAHRSLVLLDLRGTGESAIPADPATYRCDRQVAERRRGEAWFPDAFAALQRIWSGDATAADWTAIAPFTYGRWDAVAQAHLAQEASQTNADAAAAYYSAGALDPEATSASLARLRAPVLLVAGEYDVALPQVRRRICRPVPSGRTGRTAGRRPLSLARRSGVVGGDPGGVLALTDQRKGRRFRRQMIEQARLIMVWWVLARRS